MIFFQPCDGAAILRRAGKISHMLLYLSSLGPPLFFRKRTRGTFVHLRHSHKSVHPRTRIYRRSMYCFYLCRYLIYFLYIPEILHFVHYGQNGEEFRYSCDAQKCGRKSKNLCPNHEQCWVRQLFVAGAHWTHSTGSLRPNKYLFIIEQGKISFVTSFWQFFRNMCFIPASMKEQDQTTVWVGKVWQFFLSCLETYK